MNTSALNLTLWALLPSSSAHLDLLLVHFQATACRGVGEGHLYQLMAMKGVYFRLHQLQYGAA